MRILYPEFNCIYSRVGNFECVWSTAYKSENSAHYISRKMRGGEVLYRFTPMPFEKCDKVGSVTRERGSLNLIQLNFHSCSYLYMYKGCGQRKTRWICFTPGVKEKDSVEWKSLQHAWKMVSNLFHHHAYTNIILSNSALVFIGRNDLCM